MPLLSRDDYLCSSWPRSITGCGESSNTSDRSQLFSRCRLLLAGLNEFTVSNVVCEEQEGESGLPGLGKVGIRKVALGRARFGPWRERTQDMTTRPTSGVKPIRPVRAGRSAGARLPLVMPFGTLLVGFLVAASAGASTGGTSPVWDSTSAQIHLQTLSATSLSAPSDAGSPAVPPEGGPPEAPSDGGASGAAQARAEAAA